MFPLHSSSSIFIFFQHPANIHLLLQVHVVLQVSQTSLVQPRCHLSDVAAQVLEQLRVAVAASQALLGLPGQVDGVEDVLVPEEGEEMGWGGDRSAQVSCLWQQDQVFQHTPALDVGLQLALPDPLRMQVLQQLFQICRVVTDEPARPEEQH